MGGATEAVGGLVVTNAVEDWDLVATGAVTEEEEALPGGSACCRHGSLVAGTTLAIVLYLCWLTVAWLAARWSCRLGGREGVGSTRMAKCAVEANSGLAIAGGETEGGSATQGPDLQELIH